MDGGRHYESLIEKMVGAPAFEPELPECDDDAFLQENNVYSSRDKCLDAVEEYALFHGFGIYHETVRKNYALIICKATAIGYTPACEWYCEYGKDRDTGLWVIRTLSDHRVHTCPPDLKARVDVYYRLKAVHLACRLRELIKTEVYGDWHDSFRLFPTLAKRFKTIDPHSSVKILTYNGHFHRIFVSPSASRVALQHCRPVVALDGTFLLNLFTKTFPEWMERENAAIISDRDKGLVPAAKEFLPDTIPHYFCGWHLEQNIRRWGTDAKIFFWRMLKARLLPKWKALLREARVDFSKMADYLFRKEERPRAPPGGVGSSAPPPASNPEETTQEARARIRQRARMNRRARAQRLRQRKAAQRRAARRTATDGTAGVAEEEEVDGGSDAAAAGAAGDVHAEDGADADDAAENGASCLNDTQDGPAWNDQARDGAAVDDGSEDGEAGNGPAGAPSEAAPDTRAPRPARGPLIVVPTPPNLEARRPPFDIDNIILSARNNYFPGHGRRYAADGVGTTQALLPPLVDPAGPAAAAGTGAAANETPGGDAAGTGAPAADMPAAEPDLTQPCPDLGEGVQAGTDEDVIGEGLDYFTTDENVFSNPSTSRPQRPVEDDGPARARTGFHQNKAGSKYRIGIHPKHWARVYASTARYGIYTSNAAESVNSAIRPIRQLPLVYLIAAL
ncbi:unnamed protein product [Closterium sp. Yama58-4]|nr:unnamed protein product [Closterium sp. Yama58-4]